MYSMLCFDIEKMKDLWAELIGFKASEVVGKIAPEIKPGKYSYADKGKHPGLKELMIPLQYERFKPGEPPHVGSTAQAVKPGIATAVRTPASADW